MNTAALDTKPNVDFESSSKKVTSREISSFPERVFQILEQCNDESSLWWTESGTSFCVLPKNFNNKEAVENFQGTQFSSIMRRLFRYGFDRVATQKGCKAFPTGSFIFENQFFRKGRPDLLNMIKIDNKRLYRRALQRDEPSPTFAPRRYVESRKASIESKHGQISSSEDNTKPEHGLQMHVGLRYENDSQNIQVVLNNHRLANEYAFALLRARNQATNMTRGSRCNHDMNILASLYLPNKVISNDLLIKSHLLGTRYF